MPMNNENKHLICFACKNIYKDPVLISCGETVCKECIKATGDDQNSFECIFCSEMHEIPKIGFPLNKLATKLMEENIEFNLNRCTPCLSNCFSLIKASINEIKLGLNNPSDSLFEYCSDLKRKVQLTTETKILSLNEMNENCIKEIEQFQKDCSANLKEKEKCDLHLIETFFQDVSESYEKWVGLLKQPKLRSNEITNAVENLSSLQFKMQNALSFYRSLIFNSDHVLNFNKNLDSNSYGWLELKRTKIPKFSELKSADLSSIFGNVSSTQLANLDNGNLVLASGSRVLLLNENRNLVKTLSIEHDFSSMGLQRFSLYCHAKNIIFYLILSDLKKTYEEKHMLYIYDQDLCMSQKYSFFEFNSICFDDTRIYGSSSGTLKIYDWNVNHLSTIESKDLSGLCFHLPSASMIDYLDSNFIFKTGSGIEIVSQTDGKLNKTIIDIDCSHNFVIDREENIIIARNKDKDKMLYFTSKGEQFWENELIDYPKDLNFFAARNGILFYDLKKILFMLKT